MKTQNITAAAVFSKKGGGVQLKIWWSTPPEKGTVAYFKWLDNDGVIFPFADDLQSGKFMWAASYKYSGESYWNDLQNSGVFLAPELIALIDFVNDDMVYMKPPAGDVKWPPVKTVSEFEIQSRLNDLKKDNGLLEGPEMPSKGRIHHIPGKTLFWYLFFAGLLGVFIGLANGFVLGVLFF